MKTFEFEVGLAVADHNGEFESCQENLEGALEAAKEELLEAGVSQETLNRLQMTAEFVEFDSANPVHVNGMFHICLSGEEVDVDDAGQKWTAWMDE